MIPWCQPPAELRIIDLLKNTSQLIRLWPCCQLLCLLSLAGGLVSLQKCPIQNRAGENRWLQNSKKLWDAVSGGWFGIWNKTSFMICDPSKWMNSQFGYIWIVPQSYHNWAPKRACIFGSFWDEVKKTFLGWNWSKSLQNTFPYGSSVWIPNHFYFESTRNCWFHPFIQNSL